MPLSARFNADFTSFYDAVQKAEVSLKSFESGAGRVGTSLNRMVDQFSGRKLIQEAAVMTAAIEKAGGASILTADELQSVSAKAAAAADKMQKLGVTVPPAMQELADSFKGAGHEASGFRGFLDTLGSSFVAHVTEGILLRDVIREVITVIKEAVTDAAKLQDLSLATGVSVHALQQLSYVGAEFGVGLDEMARGVEQFSAKLANGDPNAVRAVQMLGLNLKELLALGPEGAFLAFAEAAGRVDDPMLKGALAADAFGGKLAKILLPALTDLRKRMEDVPSSAIISDENITKAHDFDVGLQHVMTTLKAYSVAVLGFLTRTPNLVEGMDSARAAQLGGGPPEKLGTIQLTPDPKVITALDSLKNHLAALRTAALEPLTAAQRENILSLQKWGEGEAEIAKDVGASKEAVHLYLEAVKASTEEQKKADAATKKWLDSISSIGSMWNRQNWTGLVADLSAVENNFQKLTADAVPLDSALSQLHQTTEDLQRSGRFLSVAMIAVNNQVGLLTNVVPLNTQLIHDATAASTDWIGDLDKLAVGFERMARLAHGSLATMARDIGTVIATVKLVKASTDEWVQGLHDIKAGEKAQGFAEIAASIGGMVAAMDQATSHASRLGNVLGGAMTGAQIGSALGPLGTAIGAAAGGAFGFLRSLFANPQKEINPIRQAFVDAAGGLDVLNQRAHDAGVTLNAMLNARNAEQYKKAIDDLNKAFEEHDKKIKQAETDILGLADSFNSIVGGFQENFVNYAKLGDAVTSATKALDDLRKHGPGQSSGADPADVATYGDAWAIAKGKVDDAKDALNKLQQQGAKTADQIAAGQAKVNEAIINATDAQNKFNQVQMAGSDAAVEFARQIGKAEADLNKALAAQKAAADAAKQELDDLGTIAVATFAAMQAAGFGFAASLTKVHTGLMQLRKAYHDLGLDVDNVALKELLIADAILTNAPQLLAAVDSLGSSFDVLSKYGLLNVDTFEAMERTGMSMYVHLQAQVAAAGGATRDALMPMQTYLHQAEAAAKALGIPIDDNTQMLISQSKELGLWKEAGKTANELLLEGLTKLVNKLDEFLSRLAGIPPVITTDINTNYTSTGDPGAVGNYAASGGMVTAHGIQHFMRGGRVLPFRPRGTDTVPAMLTPGEIVLTRAQQARLAQTGGGDTNELKAEIASLKRAILFEQPALIAKSVAVGLVKSGGRKR